MVKKNYGKSPPNKNKQKMIWGYPNFRTPPVQFLHRSATLRLDYHSCVSHKAVDFSGMLNSNLISVHEANLLPVEIRLYMFIFCISWGIQSARVIEQPSLGYRFTIAMLVDVHPLSGMTHQCKNQCTHLTISLIHTM